MPKGIVLKAETHPLPDDIRPLEIIRRYYEPGTVLYKILTTHNRLVMDKALAVAQNVRSLEPDVPFIKEAVMLHDIGIFLTEAPELCCTGKVPYIRHGVLGRELLDNLGLYRHALVCERHVGTGITAADIRQNRLPLPERDMTPQTLEETIIAYADKFYSKDCGEISRSKTVEDIVSGLKKHGDDKVQTFRKWVGIFEETASGTEITENG